MRLFVEHLHRTTAIRTTNGTLVVGGLKTMFLLAISAFEEKKGTVDGMAGRDVPCAEVD
jgi:hypothetical protein